LTLNNRDTNLSGPMIKNRCAFTLIELLIVVAIIAILAAIAVPNFLEAQVRSKVSRVKADMRSIATAVESYAVDHNKPPVRQSNWSIPNPPRFYPPPDTKVFDPAIPDAAVGMKMLTSPIAYITSLPSDVFNMPMRNRPEPGITDGLDYWDPGQTDSFVSFCISPVQPVQQGRGRGYLLLSVGPDQHLGLAPVNEWPHSGPTTNTYLWFYDPTNGTVSSGNVFRFSGGLEQRDLRQ